MYKIKKKYTEMLTEHIFGWKIEIFFLLSSGIFQFIKWIHFTSISMKEVIM